MTRETTYERRCETDKAVCLDEFVEVDTKKLHSDAKVAPKVEVFRHFDDIVFVIGIPFPEVVEDLYLYKSLMMETFLVSNDLYGDRLASAMIAATQDLTKRTFPEGIRDFVSER